MATSVYRPRNAENPHLKEVLKGYETYESNEDSIFLKPVDYSLPRVVLKKDSKQGLDSVRVIGGDGKHLGRILLALDKDGFKMEVPHGRE